MSAVSTPPLAVAPPNTRTNSQSMSPITPLPPSTFQAATQQISTVAMNALTPPEIDSEERVEGNTIILT